jgi:hypothetical protein
MRTLIACSALLYAGCATTEATDETSFDVARLVGTSIAARPGGIGNGAIDMVLLSIGALPAGLHYDAAGTVVGTRDGVDYRYTVWCERCGVPGPCDWFTTTATVVAAWSGAVHQPDLDVLTTGDGMWQVTRMCKDVPGAPVVSGSSVVALTAQVGDIRYEVTEQIRHRLRVRYLFLPPPPQLAGTIQIDLAGTTGDTTLAVSGEAELANTPTASLVLDDWRYQLDLASGAVTLPFAGE